MALFTEKTSLPTILKSPEDFLYLFASDKFIANLSSRYRKTVYTKNILQRKWINTWAINTGSSYETWRDSIRRKIVEVYGEEPEIILHKLAMGQEVAGKNWEKGVYGIGKNYMETFSQNNTITVDTKTGSLMQNGEVIKNQTAVYSGSGKVVGYTVTVDGAQYQSTKHGGSYYAGSYSNADVQQNADGSAYVASNAESMWQNFFTMLPQIKSFVEWIFSFFKLGTPMTTEKVVTNQKDWVKEKNNSDLVPLYFLAGAALVVALFK